MQCNRELNIDNIGKHKHKNLIKLFIVANPMNKKINLKHINCNSIVFQENKKFHLWSYSTLVFSACSFVVGCVGILSILLVYYSGGDRTYYVTIPFVITVLMIVLSLITCVYSILKYKPVKNFEYFLWFLCESLIFLIFMVTMQATLLGWDYELDAMTFKMFPLLFCTELFLIVLHLTSTVIYCRRVLDQASKFKRLSKEDMIQTIKLFKKSKSFLKRNLDILEHRECILVFVV